MAGVHFSYEKWLERQKLMPKLKFRSAQCKRFTRNEDRTQKGVCEYRLLDKGFFLQKFALCKFFSTQNLLCVKPLSAKTSAYEGACPHPLAIFLIFETIGVLFLNFGPWFAHCPGTSYMIYHTMYTIEPVVPVVSHWQRPNPSPPHSLREASSVSPWLQTAR